MSNSKKIIRNNFRSSVFKRDKYTCVMCGSQPKVEDLDAHHICDRSLMPNGGYVQENGITLCKECHIKAEQFHSTGQSYKGYSPKDLYTKINSSYTLAKQKSELLK